MSSQDISFPDTSEGAFSEASEEGFSEASGMASVDHAFEQVSDETGQSVEEDDLQVTVAMPPSLFADQVTSVMTGSVALDVLDQLQGINVIGKERAAVLRRKYNELKDKLETSHQVENSLIVEVQALEYELSKQQRFLNRAAAFPEGDNSEIGRLRQNLLTHQNELDQIEERIGKLQKESNSLEDEQAHLEKDYSRQPKREEIEKHINNLTRQKDDICSEIEKRSADIERLREDLDSKNFKIASIRQDTDELCHMGELLQAELIEIRNKSSIPKEIDNIKKQQREIQEKMKEHTHLLHHLKPQIIESENRNVSIKTMFSDVMVQLAEAREMLETDEIHLDRLNTDISTSKEREISLHEDRATLELHWKHRSSEHRELLESISSKNKLKDKDLKTLKKTELQLSVLKQQLQQINRKNSILESDRAEQGVWLSEIQASREQLIKEVEVLRKSLSLIVGRSDGHGADLDKVQTTEQDQRAEFKQQIGIRHILTNEVVSLTRSRNQEAKDFYRAEQQKRLIADDLHTKDVLIEEHKKKNSELQIQLNDFATAYEVVQSERNKIFSQIQLLHQIGAELAQKTKVLQNEVDILRTSVVAKDKLLQKCALVGTTKLLERDTQRQEVIKLKLGESELSYDLDGSREEIHKLTQQIKSAELQLNRHRRQYEQSVQDRNDLGLQLIERNEEVCVFYEKINIQESKLREANLELSTREEEVRFLNMEVSRLQNNIEHFHNSLPDKQRLEIDLATARAELNACQSDLQQLENAVQCASDPSRLRLLPGDNPSRSELNEKINKLELQLSEHEQQLLEKELLFEQVSKLTDRANKKVEGQRSSTLAVAKKVNMYQKRIQDTTRQMMALVSELSMTQATALSLEHESRETEVHLEQAYSRLAKGEPVDEESKVHWERLTRDKERKQKEEISQRKFQEEVEAHTLPNGVISYAEPRPNAYMPVGEGDLPIAKPYGNLAPFKPSQPGANLRHIRKPESKPIDI